MTKLGYKMPEKYKTLRSKTAKKLGLVPPSQLGKKFTEEHNQNSKRSCAYHRADYPDQPKQKSSYPDQPK